jgi:aspartate/methionine/tyrosine aminotransferase
MSRERDHRGQDFAALVADDILPSRMPDVRSLRNYLKEGSPHGDPICLSFGETWNRVPTGLLGHLEEQPLHAHGYQLSMYGLPALRKTARDHLVTSQRITGSAEPGRDFETAVSWTGTRGAMFDFGRFLTDEYADEHPDDRRTPIVLAAGPSWDYEGVYGSLGYRVRYHHLSPEQGFRPSLETFAEQVDRVTAAEDERLALVVINAQHNPTAVNWDPRFVADSIELAFSVGAALLVDDAYFSVHDPDVEPTSALRLLLERLPDAPAAAKRRWLAVRSLGKQFHCNGWGLGMLSADPTVLETLVNEYRLHSSLMYGGIYQHAMASWLTDPASDVFLAEQRHDYQAKRRMVEETFVKALGYPESEVHPGQCSSYLMFGLPAAYRELPDGCGRFREDCFERTGVLFAPAWPWPYAPTAAPLPYMRMYIGPERERIEHALTRMESAGIHYGMAAD